ncbi:MAG: amidoligase family protein [Oligoflexia bacterium]|nr:amidoligase family protein [Oligoflexia bacterium]
MSSRPARECSLSKRALEGIVVVGALIFALLLPLAYAGPRFGVELEYASENSLQPKLEGIPPTKYVQLLDTVKESFGGGGAAIALSPWTKYQLPGAQKASYQDPAGRVWEVVPEAINTTGWDGFELVTPPLESDSDIQLLKGTFRRIREKGEFGKGLRSSMHVTVDVASLVDADGSATRLVDTILFIENHWPEIYGAVSPTRYGTIVNRFSVPLALAQPNLLKELAEMPPAQRSFDNVRALFERYSAQEKLINEGNQTKAWKYRAANYKKLFGLEGESPLRVIEFRIADLPTEERDLERSLGIFRNVIEHGAASEPQAPFSNPFEGLTHKTTIEKINQKIYTGASDERFQSFLKKIRLSPADHPKFNKLNGTPTLLPTTRQIEKVTQEISERSSIDFGHGPVTLGFEAEFRGPNSDRVIDSGRVRTDRFPFLTERYSTEMTGNIEVRSPGNAVTLGQIADQMQQVKTALNDDLRGFHLHMRIPLADVQRIPDSELRGWLSRVSDMIYLWRLENRKHYFALKTSTQGRISPDELSQRGTIRAFRVGDHLDIEIRGFMDEVEMIKRTARTILTGVKRPDLVRGLTEEQQALARPNKTLVGLMQEFSRKYHGRELTSQELSALTDIANNAVRGRGHVPLFPFEKAPYLSELEKIRIHDASFEFQKKTLRLIQKAAAGEYPSADELHKQYRYLIKQWSQSLGLQSLLERSLLLGDSLPDQETAAGVTTMDEMLPRMRSMPETPPLTRPIANAPRVEVVFDDSARQSSQVARESGIPDLARVLSNAVCADMYRMLGSSGLNVQFNVRGGL